MNLIKFSSKATLGIILLGFSLNLSAALISAPNQLSPESIVITFDELPVGTNEPVTINGVTFTDNNASTTSGIQPQGWTQHPGIFEGQYFGLGKGDRGFIIDFNGVTVSEFGMGIFDPNYTGNTLTAYDINNNVLETITSNVDPEFPVGPPGGSFSTFVGFTRATNDIARLELRHVTGDWLGIDNVTFNRQTSSVPEPSTMWLLSIGMVGVIGNSFRRKK
ncbi:MAG: PEP-CTERM sorting domain-containing protein [Crenarchaeota archaeon]|nr:PEP-CTERM sorting domain-containing protein [Thermoproteota archaeon]